MVQGKTFEKLSDIKQKYQIIYADPPGNMEAPVVLNGVELMNIIQQ